MTRLGTSNHTSLRILLALGAGLLLCLAAARARRDGDVGIDSYYYQTQARSLRETGALQYPRSYSLAAPLIVALIGQFGSSDEQALRVAVVLGVEMLVFTVGVLVYNVGGSRLAVAFAATAVTTAGALRFLVVEYLSQLLGLSLFAAVVASVMRSERERCQRLRYIGVALALSVLSPLVHPSGSILVIVFLGAYAGIRWSNMYSQRATQVIAMIIPLLTLGIMAARSTADMPPTVARVLLEMKPIPIPVLSSAFAPDAIALAIAAGAWVSVRQGATLELRHKVDALLLTGAAIGLNPWANYLTNLGGALSRLALDTFVFAAIGAAAVIAVAGRTRPRLAIAVTITTLALIAVPRFVPGESLSFLESRRELRSLASKLKDRIPPGAALIAKHGDQFLLTYVLRVESASRRQTVHAPNDRVWWVLFNPSNSCAVRDTSIQSTLNLSVLAEAQLLETRQHAPLSWQCIVVSNPHQRVEALD